MSRELRLGVNIDHVATLRNARGGRHPDPLRAAHAAARAGADGITAHLREDRRHITDDDIARLSAECELPINMELAATEEMLAITLRHRPHAACLVPERRAERTTEGGLDAAGSRNELAPYVEKLSEAGVQVALFVEPETRQLEAAKALGAAAVELHTGAYCNAMAAEPRGAGKDELRRLQRAAAETAALGLECHAGHGLDVGNVGPVAAIPEVVELNIGHFLVGEAVFVGLEQAIRQMRAAMDEARAAVGASGAA